MENQNSAKHYFSNRIVLVTGGTGALGRAITKAFVESNATVISSYVNDREIYQVKTEIKSATVRLTKADITKEGKVDE
jgi:NAD(P)-dependent dehydrogenase (short-subunit alcohol dehydrogenase family)